MSEKYGFQIEDPRIPKHVLACPDPESSEDEIAMLHEALNYISQTVEDLEHTDEMEDRRVQLKLMFYAVLDEIHFHEKGI